MNRSLKEYKENRTIDEAYENGGVADNVDRYYIEKFSLWGGYPSEWNRQRQFAKENYRIDLQGNKSKIRK